MTGSRCAPNAFLMKTLLTAIALSGLRLLAPCDTTAGETWHGPSCDTLGVRLAACSLVNPDAPLMNEAERESPVYRWVRRRDDLVWVSYAINTFEPFEWPKGRAPVLYPGPVYPAVGFGVDPELRPLPLTRLDPSAMLRGKFPCCREPRGCAILFVGYPRGTWKADSMTALRLEPLP